MLDRFLDRVGNWNPQLRRELKTRLTLPNLTISTVISLLTQLLTLILPDRRVLEFNNLYWYVSPVWWLHIYELLDLEIWCVLAVGGTYLIAKDFDREIRTGTLDLINLSPVKPWEILLGKLLGVPILIYWVVLLALPLHTIALVQMAVPHAWVWDAIGLILLGLLDLGAIFATLTASLPPLILSLVFATVGWSGLAMITSSQISQRMTGSYARLGIYFPEEWQTILTVIANFLAIGYTLFILIQSWYPYINSRSPRRPGIPSLLIYSCLLFLCLVLLARAPQAMLVMTIGLSITTKIALNEKSRSTNPTIP
jgi:ABC-type transport system involved in cytochrome c biogenesis permease component